MQGVRFFRGSMCDCNFSVSALLLLLLLPLFLLAATTYLVFQRVLPEYFSSKSGGAGSGGGVSLAEAAMARAKRRSKFISIFHVD